jgi:hypothetical protein
MNALLNELIAAEVGVNDGRFLAPIIQSPLSNPGSQVGAEEPTPIDYV